MITAFNSPHSGDHATLSSGPQAVLGAFRVSLTTDGIVVSNAVNECAVHHVNCGNSTV